MKKYGKLLRQFATVLCKLGSVNLFVLTVINLRALKRNPKKGLDFLSIPPYFGTTFFPDLCVPPMYFHAVEGQRGSFNQIKPLNSVKLNYFCEVTLIGKCLIKLEHQYNKGW